MGVSRQGRSRLGMAVLATIHISCFAWMRFPVLTSTAWPYPYTTSMGFLSLFGRNCCYVKCGAEYCLFVWPELLLCKMWRWVLFGRNCCYVKCGVQYCLFLCFFGRNCYSVKCSVEYFFSFFLFFLAGTAVTQNVALSTVFLFVRPQLLLCEMWRWVLFACLFGC